MDDFLPPDHEDRFHRPSMTSTAIKQLKTHNSSDYTINPASETVIYKRKNLESLLTESLSDAEETLEPPKLSSSRKKSPAFAVPSVPLRRSTRISNRSISVPLRRSVRLMSVSSPPKPKQEKLKPAPTKSKAKTKTLPIIKGKLNPPPQRKKMKIELFNTYLNSSGSTQMAQNITEEKHKSEVLKLFNTGTMKEIGILPAIGTKTAYMIITNRTLYGKFKSVEDFDSRIRPMKGKSLDGILKVRNS